MNKEDEARQIRETRSLLQKAGQRHSTLETKREALHRLISLTRTNSRELKVFSAQNFSHYFKDFPDMEAEVIDCVYDICEDSEPSVRIEGYKAIVSLSSESRKLTRRNTDVLVQLLQSDEPTELKQIEDALFSHIKLDPPAAIGVLCDHCSLEPDLSPEEHEDRTNLRKLVLIFICRRAKRTIFSQFRGPESEAEVAFRKGLLKALLDADEQETKIIVEELLLPLGSFSTPTAHGNELLEILLEKTRARYTAIKSQPGPISLVPLHPYLSLLDLVAVTNKAAGPGPLLRFYSMTLIGKIPLEKLDKYSQISVIEKLADILPVCEQARMKDLQSPLAEELAKLRNMVVDACPHLLEKLVNFNNLDRKKWGVTVALLKACVQRHEEQKWEAPSNLVPTLTRLNSLTEIAVPGVMDLSKEACLLIERLNIRPSEPVPPTSLTQLRPTSLKRKLESGDRPSSASQGTLGALATSNVPLRQAELERIPRGSKLSRTSGDVSTGYILKTAGTTTAATPSLLSRMEGVTIENGGLDSSHEEPDADVDTPVVKHFSIKGAAKRKDSDGVTPPQVPPISRSPPSPRPTSGLPTLLDRLTGGDNNGVGSVRKRQRRNKIG